MTTVIDAGTEIFEGGLSLSCGNGDRNVIIAVYERIEQIPEPVGRTLLVIVDEDDVIACGIVAPSTSGHCVFRRFWPGQ